MSSIDTTGWLPGYDATTWQDEDLLPTAYLYFLYNDANYAAPASAYTRFEQEGHRIATICVMNTTVANEYDWEAGNQDECGQWLTMMKTLYGYTGVVYCDPSNVAAVLAQGVAVGITPYIALANWTGSPPATVTDYGAGIMRVQYSDQGDGGNVDLSLVNPAYPVIGPKLGTVPTQPNPDPAPPAPPVPAPVPVEASDTYQYRATHNTYTPLTVDGAFGANSTQALQFVIGATVDGVFGPGTVTALQTMLQVTADGLLGPATIKALQTLVGADVDGVWGVQTSVDTQNALNAGTLD